MLSQSAWLRATLEEAWGDFSLLLFLGFLIAAAIRSRAEVARRSRASIRWTAFCLLFHFASLPLLGWLASHGEDEAYGTCRILSLAFATIAGINIVLAIVFDGILRSLRAEAPRIAQDVVAAGAYLVGGLVLLSTGGVNLSGIIATSAVLTAVIGFALQDTLGNLIGGVALQIDKSIRPGDWVEFSGQQGRVLEMRWRQTTIETRDGEALVVPNSLLAKTQFLVLGRIHNQPLQWRRWVHLQIDYRHAPAEVIGIVEEALRRAPIAGVSAEPKPDCCLIDVRGSFNTFGVRYWLTDLQRDAPIDSVVRTRVYVALQRAGIPLTMPAAAVFLTNESEERRQRKEKDLDRSRENVLRGAELFGGLDEDEIHELAAGLRFSPFSAGEVMTRQGSEGHDLYFIHQGRVSVRVIAGKTESEVAQLGVGAFFGERSLMTGDVRSATTVALTDVVCYRLAKTELEKVLKRRPELAEQLADILARREVELDARRQDLTAEAREHRIAAGSRQLVSKIRSFFGL